MFDFTHNHLYSRQYGRTIIKKREWTNKKRNHKWGMQNKRSKTKDGHGQLSPNPTQPKMVCTVWHVRGLGRIGWKWPNQNHVHDYMYIVGRLLCTVNPLMSAHHYCTTFANGYKSQNVLIGFVSLVFQKSTVNEHWRPRLKIELHVGLYRRYQYRRHFKLKVSIVSIFLKLILTNH